MRREPALHPHRRGACYGASGGSALKALAVHLSHPEGIGIGVVQAADVDGGHLLIAHLAALTAAGLGLRHGCTSPRRRVRYSPDIGAGRCGWDERDNPRSEAHVKYDSQLLPKYADRLSAEAGHAVMTSTGVAP